MSYMRKVVKVDWAYDIQVKLKRSSYGRTLKGVDILLPR